MIKRKISILYAIQRNVWDKKRRQLTRNFEYTEQTDFINIVFMKFEWVFGVWLLNYGTSMEQTFSNGDLQEYTDICFPNSPRMQFLGI